MAGDEERKKTVQVSIGEDLHKKFRHKAFDRNTTMTDVLRTAIEDYVNEDHR